jgi:hypothetical protein
MTNIDSEVVVPKKAVAKHFLLNAQGEVVENETDATGIRYTQLSTNDTFDYQISDAAKTMLAVFGAKTLATNESSQVRNNPKGAGSDAEQMEAIRNRFALLDQGEWVDRAREGGATINKDWLTEAVIQVMLEDGKITEDQAAGDAKDKIRQKVEDAAYVKIARQHPRVAANYAKLAGRTVKSTDDLMAALS